jgi:hypothetical protein
MFIIFDLRRRPHIGRMLPGAPVDPLGRRAEPLGRDRTVITTPYPPPLARGECGPPAAAGLVVYEDPDSDAASSRA